MAGLLSCCHVVVCRPTSPRVSTSRTHRKRRPATPGGAQLPQTSRRAAAERHIALHAASRASRTAPAHRLAPFPHGERPSGRARGTPAPPHGRHTEAHACLGAATALQGVGPLQGWRHRSRLPGARTCGAPGRVPAARGASENRAFTRARPKHPHNDFRHVSVPGTRGRRCHLLDALRAAF